MGKSYVLLTMARDRPREIDGRKAFRKLFFLSNL
jgi:hypothetical protein